MKKSFIFGAALMLMGALSFQSCSQEDNAGSPVTDPVTADINAGADLVTLLEKYSVDGVLVLPAGANITIDKTVELATPVYIVGDKDKPALITAKAGFMTNSTLSFENVDVDATSLEEPFIQLAVQNGTDPINLDLIAFKNSTISGLKYQFIYANKQPYLVDCINIQKSVIGIDGSKKKTTFDFNGGGNVSFLGIDESTIYSVPTVANNGGFFSSQSGKEVTDLGGTTQTFAISNSTLYNIANGKTVNTLRKNSQAYQKFAVKNSVIVNCGKSGQFLKGLNAGQAGKDTNWEVEGNCFNWGGEVIAEQKIGSADDNIKNSIDKVVEFADAEKGNFTQQQTSAGDPRWIANAQ
jgi:hypothetical protein